MVRRNRDASRHREGEFSAGAVRTNVSEHLDDFAATHAADTWKSLPDPMNWQSGVMQKLEDPAQRVIFSLDGVDVWPGATRAAAGRGGATDWELLQMRNRSFPNLEFWTNGQRVGNPFE